MGNVQSLSHSKWECIYHITWIPKYRKKKIYEELRKYLGEFFKELARQKECEVMEGHLMSDHVRGGTCFCPAFTPFFIVDDQNLIFLIQTQPFVITLTALF